MHLSPYDSEHFPEIREGVRRLCAEFPGEYWRELDSKREYPTAFVKALRYGPEGPPESPEIADAEASPDARVASEAPGRVPEPKPQPEADSGPEARPRPA